MIRFISRTALLSLLALLFIIRNMATSTNVLRRRPRQSFSFLQPVTAPHLMLTRRRRPRPIFSVMPGGIPIDTEGSSGMDRFVIDSAVHVWSNGTEPHEWAGGEPPKELQGSASGEDLVALLGEAGVSGALLVQPINHKFDHSYMRKVLRQFPSYFKGMALADPSGSSDEARQRLNDLIDPASDALAPGDFPLVGVRFNPKLWPPDVKMNDDVGQAMYERCGQLNAPVGFLCMASFATYADQINDLAQNHPSTPCIIDHFGFVMQDGQLDMGSFRQLLDALERSPQMHVKVSAFFRNSVEGYPYSDLLPLMRELLSVAGCHRLMWGSDFPFVTLQDDCQYAGASRVLVDEWAERVPLYEEELDMVLGGTATKLFGPWADRYV
ncbi:unnamed protein product [Vitrella brassicaformis CCMP3155]|uniref:Amidohydrolase-related domain-containing protein n=2 Tax=Vitrella brassicaformis TaxID=1169539 RepID=A0A0G4FKC7_VITBC|nr:unnamed protein product [Vitrella brassicaformis CCMP3155]|mmetsp:Transcript_24468/g.60441  ORF Transcript_24468/g.60441 Transcript_24468/m.60441 type:complete len:382 (+) Transcript_24468:88-1233(+)|eukprot:CEM14294.1 unnamed protein product [Vitrella brassicaformis CCMP3155]